MMIYSKENSFLEERIDLIYEFLNSIKIEKNVNPCKRIIFLAFISH